MKKIFKWRYNLVSYLFVIFVVNVFLLNLPLTRVFGFEFAVVNSTLLVLLSALYTVQYFKKNPLESKKKFITELFKSFLFFLLVPFTVSVTNSLFTGFCSFTDGVLYYLFLTFPSVVIGAGISMPVNLYLKRFRRLAVIVLYVIILLIVGVEFYFNPQVYFYNPVIGYFPGAIYDEGINVSFKLISYRLINLLYFGGLFLIAVNLIQEKKKNLKNLFIFSALAVAGIFYFLSPVLGYSTTSGRLEGELEKKIESEHFVFHFGKNIPDAEAELLALKGEYYYESLMKYFKSEPEEKICAFIFKDSNQKKELFGSKNADVAKPWLNQLYVSIDNAEQTLKHEIAHCFTAEFGAGILKLAGGLNPVLIEGIASAANGLYGGNDINYMAALAYANDYRIDLKALLTSFGFYNQPSSLSYVYAGSFIHYLVEKYGIDKFKEYYGTNEFTKTYNVQLNVIVDGYYTFLASIEGTDNIHKANYYFGRSSLFQKVCPRAIANLLSNGWEHLRKEDFEGARARFIEANELADNYSAVMGLVRSNEKIEKFSESVKLLRDKIDKFKGTSYYYNLELALADAYAGINNFSKADSLYSKIIEQNPVPLLKNISLTRKLLITTGLINKYLMGDYAQKYDIINKLNVESYEYFTIPLWINLAEYLDKDFNSFVKNFNHKFEVTDFESSYAAYSLSKYLLNHSDFVNSRKYAALALRYDSDRNFMYLLTEQFRMANWFFQNASKHKLLNINEN